MKLILIGTFIFTATVIHAQTTNEGQIRHVETSMNHLTVLEFGEPITTLAVADADSFQVEHRDDKVLIKPVKNGVSTNLFVWTASRQFTYELDPAGQVASMDVLIRTEPVPDPHKRVAASGVDPDADIRGIASMVLTQVLLGSQNILHDAAKSPKDSVLIELEQVYRTKDRLYIRYSVANQTRAPFRLTAPDVYAPSPTQQPLSLLRMRNHQLSTQTFDEFKPAQGVPLAVVYADASVRDLTPGQQATGVVSVSIPADGSPHLYRLSFGNLQNGSLSVAAVL